jgi:hypothetical protein
LIFSIQNPQSLAQTPGPDLAWQDAVMESEAFRSSENSCISTSRRARAGWLPKPKFHSSSLRTVRAIKAYSGHVAPPDPVPVSGRGGQAAIPGPDLGYQDAAMESQAFISSENSCMCTSRRASRSRPGLGTGRAGQNRA